MGNGKAPSPQPLPAEFIPRILLRLPPDDPAGLVRASAVCKAGRCIITDPAFAGRYRAFHPTAPVLGFLHRPSNNRKDPRFISTTSFRPAAADHRQHPLDYGRYDLDQDRPAALVGDSLYFLCWPGILRYRYGLLRRLGTMDILSAGIREGDVLSMLELPRGEGEGLSIRKNADVVVMEAEGGGLGLACLCPKTGTMLYLLARETEGTAGDDGRWVQRRVIDLKTLIPVGNDPKRQPCFRGVAQDANVIFVSTEDGVFSIDHGGSSLQARKLCEMGVVGRWIYPFVSFYTESLLLKLASSKLPSPVGNQ